MNKLDFNGGAYRCEVVEGAIFEGNVGNLVAHFATDTITLHDRATRSAVSILSSRTENLQINGSVVSFEQAQTIIENALKQGGGGGASSADAVTYDNTTSGLTATNVQSALDEVGANLGGFVAVENYGAKGDGVTDDTQAIQTAINTIGEGKTLLMSNVYYCTNTINVDRKVNIDCDGTIISQNCKPLFKVSSSLINIHIEKLQNINQQYEYHSDDADYNCAVVLCNVNNCNVNINNIDGFVSGLVLLANDGGCYYNNIKLNIVKCFNAVRILSINGGWCNGNNIDNVKHLYVSWGTTDTPYTIIANSVGANKYTNNANRISGVVLEYNGVSDNKPMVLNADYVTGLYVEINRLEVNYSSDYEIIVFGNNATSNFVEVNFSFVAIKYNNRNTNWNRVHQRSSGVVKPYNTINIANDIVYGSGITAYLVSAYLDDMAGVLYYSAALKTSRALTSSDVICTLIGSNGERYINASLYEYNFWTDKTKKGDALLTLKPNGDLKPITDISASKTIIVNIVYNINVR